MVLKLRALPLAFLLVLPVAAPAQDLEGVVRLSRAEYDELKDAADRASEAPAKKPAEAPPSVESAAYEIRVSPDRIALELTADVLVKASAAASRMTLPAAGLLDSVSDSGPATVGVLRDGGRIDLVFPKPGRYRVGARFLPPETRVEGQRTVDFTVLAAAAARLAGFGSDTLTVSVSGAAAEPLAVGVARPLPASAAVRAVVRAPARLAPSEKPLVLCDTVDVLRVERDRVTQRVFVRASVTRSTVSGLVLAVGKGAEVASLTGSSEPTHVVRDDGTIAVSFARPVSGDQSFSLLLTRPAPGDDARVELEATRVEGAASSRSYVLVDPNPLRNQETLADATTALSRVDAEDLPAVALAFASAGTRAYRVTGAGAKLALAAPARPVIAPPDTLLRVADLLTVFGGGGSRVDRRTFSFETRLPHLDVPIPAGEEVLAVAVDGVPAVPRVDGTSLVVSLPPSTAVRRTLELTTKAAAAVPAKRGELTVTLPPLPSPALLAKWTIVLPEDRRYRVEKTDGIARVLWMRDAPVVAERAAVAAQNWTAAQNVAPASVPAPAAGKAQSNAPVALDVRVTDENGQPLPGVTVQADGPSGTRMAVSGPDGRTSVRNLAPGRYTVRLSLSGFDSIERVETFAPGSVVSLPLAMKLGSVQEEVVVTAETATAQSRKREKRLGPDLSALRTRPSGSEGWQANAIEGGVEGGVPGGVSGGTIGGAQVVEEPLRVGGDLSEKVQAGGRSLAMDVTGHGKRLLLSGPLVGGRPVSVTLSVKPD